MTQPDASTRRWRLRRAAFAWLGIGLAVALVWIALTLTRDRGPQTHALAGRRNRPRASLRRHSAAGLGSSSGSAAATSRSTCWSSPARIHTSSSRRRGRRSALGRARLFFKVGMPFENELVERIAAHHAGLTVVDAAAGIAKRAWPRDHERRGGPARSARLALAAAAADHGGQCRGGACAGGRRTMPAEYRHNAAAVWRRSWLHWTPASPAGWPPSAASGSTSFIRPSAISPTPTAWCRSRSRRRASRPRPRQLQGLVRKARADGVRIDIPSAAVRSARAEAVARAIGGCGGADGRPGPGRAAEPGRHGGEDRGVDQG